MRLLTSISLSRCVFISVFHRLACPSRCGPMDMAVRMMAKHPNVRRLLGSMVSAVYPLRLGSEAMEKAKQKGVLKVQLQVSN